jgi:hypothetical protein
MGRPKEERAPLPPLRQLSDEQWALVEPVPAEHDFQQHLCLDKSFDWCLRELVSLRRGVGCWVSGIRDRETTRPNPEP